METVWAEFVVVLSRFGDALIQLFLLLTSLF